MRTIGATILVLAACATSSAVAASEIKIVSTNGPRAVLSQIGPQFERETGHKLQIQYGAGPSLKQRIQAGDAFDIAILPLDFTDLINSGKVIGGTRVTLGRTGYGAAIRKGAPNIQIGTTDALRGALRSSKAVAYASEGVSGTYFLNLLTRLGIADEMRTKIKPMTAEAGSMAAVAAGEADMAIGGIAVILSAPGVDLAGWLAH